MGETEFSVVHVRGRISVQNWVKFHTDSMRGLGVYKEHVDTVLCFVDIEEDHIRSHQEYQYIHIYNCNHKFSYSP